MPKDPDWDSKAFVDAFFARHQDEITVTRTEEWNGGWRYILQHCGFDEGHTGSSAAVLIRRNGVIAYVCQHASCTGKGWKQYRALFEQSGQPRPDSGVSSDPEDSEEPILRAPIPFYPVDVLPLVLRNYASASSLPPSAIASVALTALAVAIGGNAELELTAQTLVRPIVWSTPIGLSGAAKSPAGEKLLAPLYDRDRKAVDEHEAAMQAWLDGGKHGAMPVERTFVHGRETVEALYDTLHDAPDILQAFDELSVFLNDLGRYHAGKNGAVGAESGDAAAYMTGWTGAPMRSKRIGERIRGRASVKLYCARPTISLWGPLTRDNQHLLGGEGNSFRARWLPHYVEARRDLAPGEIFDPGDVGHPEYTTAWTDLLEVLLDRRGNRRIWYLSDDVKRRVREHRARWQAQARSVEATATITAALKKAEIYIGTLTLILSEAELTAEQFKITQARLAGLDQPALLEADSATVDRAARWIDFCMDSWAVIGDQATVAYSVVERLADPVVTQVELWIEQHGRSNNSEHPWVWVDDLVIHKVAGVRTRADWRTTLERYADRNLGHIKVVDTGKSGPKPRQIFAPLRRPYGPAAAESSGSESVQSGSEFPNSDPKTGNYDPDLGNSDPCAGNSDPARNGVATFPNGTAQSQATTGEVASDPPDDAWVRTPAGAGAGACTRTRAYPPDPDQPASQREVICRYCLGARGPLVGIDRRRGIHHECALETIANGVVDDEGNGAVHQAGPLGPGEEMPWR
jgi:hypothetical protein